LLSESIWLPPGISWEQLERENYAQCSHLIYPVFFAVILIGIRGLIVRLIFKPLGHTRVGLRPLPPLHQTTETPRQLYRDRINKKRLIKLDKFCETGWRWLLYLSAHLGGLYCLYDKPWLWNTAHCWYSYPYHPIDNRVWWYYMLELSLYWCLFITQFSDIKRKDFWQMFVHHIATIFLLMFSWTNHMHRMGSLVLLLHDFSDHWLELAKLVIYAGFESVGNVVFVIFAVTWLYTRLSILPTVIIYSTVYEAAQIVPMFPVYYIFNFLMTTLQILHVVWTYYILKIAYKSLVSGVLEDSRSEDGTDADDELEDQDDQQDLQEPLQQRKPFTKIEDDRHDDDVISSGSDDDSDFEEPEDDEESDEDSSDRGESD